MRLREDLAACPTFTCTCLSLFASLWIIPLLFVFVYYSLPSLVRLTVVLVFCASLIPLWSVPGSTFSAVLSMCVLTSAFCGLRVFYSSVMPLKALTEGRVYTGVYAQQPALAFPDASILSFAGNATVDDTRAASFTVLEGGPQTYCVAPIGDSTSVGRVEFWAVGMNCCPEKLSSFECDSAGDLGSSTGVVVPDLSEGDDLYDLFGKHLAPADIRRDFFLEAVAMAEAAHDLKSSSRPVLVRWTSQSRAKIEADMWRGISSTLVVMFVVLALAAGLLARMATNHEVLASVWETHSGGWQQASLLRAEGIPVAPTIRDFRQVCVLGFVIPYLVVMSSVILWSWVYCYKFGTALATIFVGVVVFLVLSLMLSDQTWIYGLVTLVCAAIGTYIGRRNYFANTFHFCSAQTHHFYINVVPDRRAVEYADAGKMRFSSDSGISVNQSFGFEYDGTIYCAAPIMSSDCAGSGACGCTADSCDLGSPSAPARTDFWAVGEDCCGDIGNFTCGAANLSIHATTGLVLRDSAEQGVEDVSRFPYMQAVQAASDHFGLMLGDDPVLVQWGVGDVEEDFERLWVGRGILVILVTAFLAFVVLTVPLSFLTMRARRQAKGPSAGSAAPQALQSRPPGVAFAAPPAP